MMAHMSNNDSPSLTPITAFLTAAEQTLANVPDQQLNAPGGRIAFAQAHATIAIGHALLALLRQQQD